MKCPNACGKTSIVPMVPEPEEYSVDVSEMSHKKKKSCSEAIRHAEATRSGNVKGVVSLTAHPVTRERLQGNGGNLGGPGVADLDVSHARPSATGKADSSTAARSRPPIRATKDNEIWRGRGRENKREREGE